MTKNSIDELLVSCGFILKIHDPNIFKLSTREIFKYRNNLIATLDRQQIQNSKSKKLKFAYTEKNNAEDTPKIDRNSKQYNLTFKLRLKQDIKKNFVLTSKGCYCCQDNFRSEKNYTSHILHHTADSNFAFLRANYVKILPQRLQVSYKHCINSSLLLFTLKDFCASKPNIIIDKIILFRSGSIHHLQEYIAPYELSSEGSKFYVDFHLFCIMYEHPLIIIYKHKGDHRVRYMEEHHFLRNDYFPLITNVNSNHVFRREELKIKEKLRDYYPSESAKALCLHNVDKSAIGSYIRNTNIRDYFNQKVSLNSENICDVLRILLEIEDFTILTLYEKYKGTKIKLQGANTDYSIAFNLADQNLCDVTLNRGDYIKLSPRNEKNKIYNGIITEITRTRIYFETHTRNLPIDVTYDVSFAPQRLSIIFQHRALQFLRSDPILKQRLFPESSILNKTSHIRLNYFNNNISKNAAQKEAVQNIVDNSNKHVPFIIFGPPGTGKTTVIVESILQLWQKSKSNKILVAAGSNAACDEIAGRLCCSIGKIDPNSNAILRIYSVSAEERYNNLNENILEASNLWNGQQFYPSLGTMYTYAIIIATLTVTGKFVHGQISHDHFTHVFIDECGASTEIESIVGLSRILSPSGHLIVSGDPKQLGPIIFNNRAAKLGLERSLLERLMDRKCYEKDLITNQYNKSIQARLVNNYRNHKDILYLSNKLYYNGDLKVRASAEITDWALGWCGLHCKTFPIIFESVKGESKKLNSTSFSLCNFTELRSVISYVQDLMFFGVKGRTITEADIGIISPYKTQCNLIRDELNRRGWYRIETGSVEIFQGKEKPIIIASMVRSKTKTVGFLDNQKRLNVLLTRAQALLIIIGNPETLGRNDGWRMLIDYCLKNNAIIGKKFNMPVIKSNSNGLTQSLKNLSISETDNRSKSNIKKAVDNGKKQKQIQLPEQSQQHKKKLKKYQKLQQENQIFQNIKKKDESELHVIDNSSTLKKSYQNSTYNCIRTVGGIVEVKQDTQNTSTDFNLESSSSETETISKADSFVKVTENGKSSSVQLLNFEVRPTKKQNGLYDDGIDTKPSEVLLEEGFSTSKNTLILNPDFGQIQEIEAVSTPITETPVRKNAALDQDTSEKSIILTSSFSQGIPPSSHGNTSTIENLDSNPISISKEITGNLTSQTSLKNG